MKKKQKQLIHEMRTEELQKKVVETRLMLEKHDSERYTKPSKNTRVLKNIRRELAVLNTTLRMKRLTEDKHGK